MSFIITVYTNEGIVMASDSRSTTSITQVLPNGTITNSLGIQMTDTTYKTFLYDNRIGISTCGAATLNNRPIAGYIEDFIRQNRDEKCTVHELSVALVDFFVRISSQDDVHFFVAGYDNPATPVVEQVLTKSQAINPIDVRSKGAAWDGETGILTRLTKPVIINNLNGTYFDIPAYPTNYDFFTLQDAIEYAQYAVDVTIKTMKFQNCVKTVGGPIDILVIKPDKAFWIKRKELHA